jgi:hypothetical protein
MVFVPGFAAANKEKACAATTPSVYSRLNGKFRGLKATQRSGPAYDSGLSELFREAAGSQLQAGVSALWVLSQLFGFLLK